MIVSQSYKPQGKGHAVQWTVTESRSYNRDSATITYGNHMERAHTSKQTDQSQLCLPALSVILANKSVTKQSFHWKVRKKDSSQVYWVSYKNEFNDR